MAKYRYRASDAAGNPVEGDIDADGEDAARDALWNQGLVPYALSSSPRSALAGLARGSRLTTAALAGLVRDLAVLVDAGLPVDRALRVLSGEGSEAPRRAVAEGLLADVIAGRSLADAAAARPVFPSEVVAMFRAGEVSGRLGPVLLDLADLLERREEIRARTRSALAYPLFVGVVALIALGVIVGVLVPSIAPIFEEGGRPMPPVVAALSALGDHAAAVFAAVFAAVAATIMTFRLARRRTVLRRRLHRGLLRLPLIGELARLKDGGRFLQTLATLVAARVPLVAALGTAGGVMRNDWLQAQAETTAGRVREGATLAAATAADDFLPPAAVQMIGVGEETGRLAEMLSRAARLAEAQERTRTERMLTLLTPLLTVAIAGVVGAFIFSVVAALLDMNEMVLR
ncbi:MAG: type II secretion system F family protein [Burkholderiales bacterium]|nr:type II secretion system F family protein [Burkholderiales bacterium]